jgi:hypothetical protein
MAVRRLGNDRARTYDVVDGRLDVAVVAVRGVADEEIMRHARPAITAKVAGEDGNCAAKRATHRRRKSTIAASCNGRALRFSSNAISDLLRLAGTWQIRDWPSICQLAVSNCSALRDSLKFGSDAGSRAAEICAQLDSLPPSCRSRLAARGESGSSPTSPKPSPDSLESLPESGRSD